MWTVSMPPSVHWIGVNIPTTVNESLRFLPPVPTRPRGISWQEGVIQLYSKADTKASYNGLIKMGRNALKQTCNISRAGKYAMSM